RSRGRVDMMRNISILCLAFLLSPISNSSANVIVNGGFETGDFSGWTLSGDSATTFVDTGFAHSGSYAAFLGEIGDLGSLSQTFSTTLGASYSLTFWFAGDGETPSEFAAILGGMTLLDLVNPPFDENYKKYNY